MKQIEAIYEQGRLRPAEPLELPEGTRLRIILITRHGAGVPQSSAEIMAEIAALPLEGVVGEFSGRDHDSIYRA